MQEAKNEQSDSDHSKNIDSFIMSQLSKTKSSDEVFAIIQSNWYQITRPGVYSLAFKLCIRYKDYLMTQKIMDFLIYSKVEPTIYQFTQFFNAMALSDASPKITDEYFQRMRNEHHIIPDTHLFCVLIKMCRKEQMYKLAEAYWTSMQKEYKIAPTSWLYTEMISVYAAADKRKRAKKLFYQFYEKLQKQEVKFDVTTFHAFLNVFTRSGDTKGMEEEAFKVIDEQKIAWNKLFVTEIMNGYINASKPEKAIEILHEWMKKTDKSKREKGMEPLLELKCKALCDVMKNDENIRNDKGKKLEIYRDIEYIMKGLMEKRSTFSLNHAKTLLTASILMYYDNDPGEMIKVFERLVNDGFIGYKFQEHEHVIALHFFDLLQIRFVLRYVIGNIKDIDRGLVLIVEAGGQSVKDFVIEELLKYRPPIHCKEDPNNSGLLLVSRQELRKYFGRAESVWCEPLILP